MAVDRKGLGGGGGVGERRGVHVGAPPALHLLLRHHAREPVVMETALTACLVCVYGFVVVDVEVWRVDTAPSPSYAALCLHHEHVPRL